LLGDISYSADTVVVDFGESQSRISQGFKVENRFANSFNRINGAT